MSTGSSRPNLILVGFMGAGKTTVGRALGLMTGLELIDLDQLIVERAGRSIADIFAAQGEAAFRDLESSALLLLKNRRRCVVASGGGVVGRPENWVLMRSLGTVVYLDTPLEVLKSRLAGETGRPLADGDANWKRIENLWQQRQPLYAQADLTVDCDDRSPEEIAREIVARLDMEQIER